MTLTVKRPKPIFVEFNGPMVRHVIRHFKDFNLRFGMMWSIKMMQKLFKSATLEMGSYSCDPNLVIFEATQF